MKQKTVELVALYIHAIGLLPFVLGASVYALYLYHYNLFDGALIFLISLVVLLATVGGLKIVTNVKRPPDALRPAAMGAFPSGHSATAAFIAIMVPYTLASSVSFATTALVAVVLGAIAILVAVSRMVLHVHTTFQVLVGLLIGIGVPLICIQFAEQLKAFLIY